MYANCVEKRDGFYGGINSMIVNTTYSAKKFDLKELKNLNPKEVNQK